VKKEETTDHSCFVLLNILDEPTYLHVVTVKDLAKVNALADLCNVGTGRFKVSLFWRQYCPQHHLKA